MYLNFENDLAIHWSKLKVIDSSSRKLDGLKKLIWIHFVGCYIITFLIVGIREIDIFNIEFSLIFIYPFHRKKQLSSEKIK